MRTDTIVKAATTAAGVVVAGIAAGVLKQRHDRRLELAGTQSDAFGAVHDGAVEVKTRDGLQLHAEVVPADDGTATVADGVPTVVFVHGWMCTLDTWHYQRRLLHGRFPMVFYDTRSHGRSDRAPRHACTLDDLTDDLEEVIAQLVPQGPIVLVGHSMGGMTIMRFVERRHDWVGGRLIGVALVGTSSGRLMRNSPGLRYVGTALRATSRLLDLGLAPGAQFMMRAFGLGAKAPQHVVDEAASMIAASSSRVVADFYENFIDLDLGESLPLLANCPTVIVTGTADRMTPTSHSRWLARSIPGSELVEIVGAGHMVMLERPEAVAEAIEEVLPR